MLLKFSQTFLALVLGILFVLIVESFGFLLIKILSYLKQTCFKETPKFTQDIFLTNFVVRYFVGLVFFCSFLFFSGVFSLLSRQYVLVSSLLIFGLITLVFQRWTSFFSFLSSLNFANLRKHPELYLPSLFVFVLIVFQSIRPIVSFDALWYHIPIPKMFLDTSNIAYNGNKMRYSVHPYMNFFWNMWPLSLKTDIGFAGLVINATQGLTVFLAILQTTLTAKKYQRFNKLTLGLTPLLLLFAGRTTYSHLGIAYNDILGMSFGLIVFIYIYLLDKTNQINFLTNSIALILICGLFSLKIFFAFPAAFAFFYLFYLNYSHLKIDKNKYFRLFNLKISFKKDIYKFILHSIVFFIILILPWLVRSYYYTGRILDPVGKPGMNLDAYMLVGSMDSINHWKSFVWNRLRNDFISILLWQFSPLFLLGLASGFVFKAESKKNSLLFFVVLAYLVSYFLSIVADPRYHLASAIVICFLGLSVLNRFFEAKIFSAWYKAFIAIIFIGLSLVSFIETVAFDYWWIHRNSDYDTYLYEMSVRKNPDIEYYGGKRSLKPKDLRRDETVFLFSHFPKSGYFENPTDGFQIFYNAPGTRVEDIVKYMKDNQIRYFFVESRHGKLEDWCQLNGIVDYKECDESNEKYWKLELSDKIQDVRWYKLK